MEEDSNRAADKVTSANWSLFGKRRLRQSVEESGNQFVREEEPMQALECLPARNNTQGNFGQGSISKGKFDLLLDQLSRVSLYPERNQNVESMEVDSSDTQFAGFSLLGRAKSQKVHTIRRKAVNGQQFFPAFYNVREDCFVDVGDHISAVTEAEFVKNNTLSPDKSYTCSIGNGDVDSRFEQLGIDSGHKASILLGMVPVKGFGRFLTEAYDTTQKENSFTLVRIIGSQKSCPSKLPKGMFSKFRLQGSDIVATHATRSVTYGAALACVFRYNNHESINVEKAKKAILQYVEGYKDKDHEKYLQAIEKHFTVRLFSDPVFQLSEEVSLTEAINHIKDMSCLLRKTDACLGHCLEYEMVPLNKCVNQKYLKDANMYKPKPTDQYEIQQALKKLERIRTYYGELQKNYQRTIKYKYAFHENVIDKLASFNQQLASMINKYEESARMLVLDIRYGNVEHIIDLWKTLDTLSKTFKHQCEAMAKELSNMHQEKIQYVMPLINSGVSYVGRNTTLNAELELMNEGYCYVMCYKRGTINQDKNQANWQLFDCLRNGGNKCVFVDLELTEKSKILPENTCIMKFKGKEAILPNCLDEEIRQTNTCVVRLANGCVHRKGSGQANNLVPLEIPCPKAIIYGGKCVDDECRWECIDCKEIVQFDKTTDVEGNESMGYLYCKCGHAPAQEYMFRCNDRNSHGIEYTQFSPTNLRLILKQLTESGETNMLVLGETGKGKSTWINSIANFMTYESLDDAIEAKDPIWLIPHSFHVDGAEVCIGDQSKKKQVGSSVTDQPMAYVFMYKGRKLRIIDTPGIGDTDGLTKDSANFKAILNYIANLKELHGICILMTPNSTRLTPAFKYCINELLTYLHRDAAKNIVFVFTNARSTNYRSAGTLPLLKEMLGGIAKNRGVNIKVDKNTTYYVDNESYLYQCQLYKGIPQNEDDLEMFRVSWKRSDKETKRLLAYIFGLEPHRTMETVSLNEAKRIVLLLAKPLAMISTVIQSQIAVTKEHSEELQKLDADSAEFRDKLETQKIEQVFVESKELPFPMTVCNNDECVEFEKDSHNITTRIYKSKCHDHCYLEGVLKETHPEPALQKCYAMCHDPDGIIRCKFCQHTWQDHLHIWYDQQVKSRFVEDKDIKERIKRNENNHAIKLRAIRNANMYKQEIEDEQTKIIEITARFGSFLHHKGIQPYNDAMKAYAEMSIKDMEQVASQTGDYRKVDGLKVCLSEYMEQKRVLDSWLKSGREKMEPGDIKHHFNTLINLKHYGGEIEKLFKQEENSQRNQMRYTENEFSNKRALKATRNVNKQVSASFGFQSGIGALAENGAGYGFGVSNIVGHLSNAFFYGHNSSVTNQQPTCFSNFQPLSLEESYSNETDKDLSDQKGKGSSESNAKSELKPAKQSKKWFQFKGLW